ncbi:MAG: hypothetical protein OIF32_04140 [Campylobacterales bacterium]|nr:hypothetical protein [Campylobacterales bacterium]
MSATIMNFDDFYGYVDSQISRIFRYKQDNKLENLTIMFVRHNDIEKVYKVLENNLRQSDVVFKKENYIFIALSNTDKMGALHVEEMLKEFFEDASLVVAYVSFPEDGDNKEELFQNLSQICDEEYGFDFEDYLK